MVYNVDDKNTITNKTFGEIYGYSLVQLVELDPNVHEDKNISVK